jgi:nucleoside-diphosphate-sugar epimerase
VLNRGTHPVARAGGLHNADLVDAVRHILRAEARRGLRAWNVERPEQITMRDYVHVLANAAGRATELVSIDYAALAGTPRSFFPCRDYACVLDSSAAQRELGWRAPTTLATGLARTFAAARTEDLAARFMDHTAEDALLMRRASRA